MTKTKPANTPKHTNDQVVLLDCTLRDGGYYNEWNFTKDLIESYLVAMKAAQVDIVELGFRSLQNRGFKGSCAFTTDEFLRSLIIPEGLSIGVMVNGSDLCTEQGCIPVIERLFPDSFAESRVDLVRFACHFHELEYVMPAVAWLTERGYRVGINLMQIADRSQSEVSEFTRMAREKSVDVLYFADSMGSMNPHDTACLIGWLREGWSGPIGIHAHDNLGLALSNTLRAVAEGGTWLDSTVTGMGRGPGNVRTEVLAIEVELMRARPANLVPLMKLVRTHFGPMKAQYGWGTNPFYYLAGKHGIHPTYIQEMLRDSRYDEEDIFAAIDFLRHEGGKKFSADRLDDARQFYRGEPRGSWLPTSVMKGREVLILGTGPGVAAHRPALESYIRRTQPLVMALNTQSAVDPDLIDLRIACHPVRLLADAEAHAELPQPLITPASMLPERLRAALVGKELLDFGLSIAPGRFEFHATYCISPKALVLAYALAVVSSGQAERILMAGFDGYPPGDARNDETAQILRAYADSSSEVDLLAITPTVHPIGSVSVYAV